MGYLCICKKSNPFQTDWNLSFNCPSRHNIINIFDVNAFYAQDYAQVPVINTSHRHTYAPLPSLLMPTLRHFFRRQY